MDTARLNNGSDDLPPGSPRKDTKAPNMQKRATVSGTIGQALEYFDFTIYGALSATIFPQLFFSDLGESGALLASFATFGVGFVARPIGAVLFGYLGDRIGRRPVLFITLLIMSIASISIGLLPTGKGFAVAAILVGLRFIQGLSLGGESTGNQLMVMEHSSQDRRGLMGAIVSVGVPASQLLASVSLVVLTSVLSEEQWLSWGWRIPFLASIALVAVAVFMRLKLTETPAFKVAQNTPVGEVKGTSNEGAGLRVVRTHPGTIAKLTLSWGGVLVTVYLVSVYGLSLMKSQGNLSNSTTFVILAIASTCGMACCLAGGWVSDRIGRKKTVLIALAGCAVGMTLFFLSMPSGSVLFIGFSAVFALCWKEFATGAQPALFAEQFPTEQRFSGSALSITFSNVLFSAPAPIVAAALSTAVGNMAVLWVTLGIIAISICAVLATTDRSGVDLISFHDTDDQELARAESASDLSLSSTAGDRTEEGLRK
ncbi:MFS transporter [Rhodococcus koreensis]|uniref:MFS transporter n=1 Tax=Rhodococcus koreensis TaxID=99653 RepID=UPI00197E1272|nr:MFS transporter [Rhodococcus koreensis]QSE86091.1 MFS transporter [Rhodococcus koreensis]